MRYVPYDELRSEPNVIVDGSATGGTLLTLSHWPKSGTPLELAADTSAEIVFNHLDRPSTHVDVNAVSNNHFDEDGLIVLSRDVGAVQGALPPLASELRIRLTRVEPLDDTLESVFEYLVDA